MEWAGTLHLSWWELGEFLRHLPQDSTSAFYRVLNPDTHMWADPQTHLLGEVASALSSMRFLAAISSGIDEVPEEWAPVRYGPVSAQPAGPVDDVGDVEAEVRARAVAAELRG